MAVKNRFRSIQILTLFFILSSVTFFPVFKVKIDSNVAVLYDRSKASGPSKCISLEKDFKTILQQIEQIFITIPAKAAGTSMKSFTDRCTNFTPPERNFLHDGKIRHEMLTWTYHNPQIITNHITRYNVNPIVTLANSVTDETMIIYLHRKETDRLLSAILQVADQYCSEFLNGTLRNSKGVIQNPMFRWIENDEDNFSISRHGKTTCTINEHLIVGMVQRGILEIGNSVQNVWTCEAFEAVEESKPNVVFIDYNQADKLMSILAKKYCPDLHIAIHTNEARKKNGTRMLVRLLHGPSKTDVTLSDWLQKKKHLLEWSQNTYKEGSCRGKIREIERELFTCNDQAMEISSIYK